VWVGLDRAWHVVWVGLEGVARGVEGAGACGKGRGVGWRAWHKVRTGLELAPGAGAPGAGPTPA
jgi:hypothetical protein